jgi:TldD protein
MLVFDDGRLSSESYRDVRPLVRINVSVVGCDENRQEAGSDGFGGEAFR